MEKKWIIGMVACLIVGGLIGGLGTLYLRPLPTTELYPIDFQTGWLFDDSDAFIYAAKDFGWYEEQGLDVNVVPGAEATATVTSLAQGQIDFLVTSASELIAAKVEGLPVVGIAIKEQLQPSVYISLAESNIDSPQDLVGKSVAIEPGGETDLLWKAALGNVLTQSEINQINFVPAHWDPAPLMAGQIDAMGGWRTNAERWEVIFDVDLTYLALEDLGVMGYGDLIVTSEKMIDENPDIVLAFVKASIRGMEWMLDPANEEEVVAIVKKWSGGAIEREATLATLPSWREIRQSADTEEYGLMWIKAGPFSMLQDLLYDGGVIEKKVSVATLFTDEFVKEAMPDGELVWP